MTDAGRPEEKAKLFMESMREVKKQYTPEKLMKMTDEEIANDFENLQLLSGYQGAAKKVADDPSLKFSEHAVVKSDRKNSFQKRFVLESMWQFSAQK